MKLSNKLILGLVASIGLYIIAAFAEIRIKGWPYGEVVRVDHTTNLSDFSYIKIDGINWGGMGRNDKVRIRITEQSSLKIQTFEGDEIPEFKYHMDADTLIIDEFRNVGRSRLEINANKKSLRGIVINRSNVNLFDQIDSLELTLSNYAQLNWRSWENNRAVNVENVRVLANQSFLQTYKVNIENLLVDDSESHLRLNGNIQNLNGSIANSKLQLKQVVNMSIAKDSLSEVNRNFQF